MLVVVLPGYDCVAFAWLLPLASVPTDGATALRTRTEDGAGGAASGE